jgi:chemotaxis protein CheX
MSKKIGVEHVNPFLKATVETFSMMIGTQVKPGKPSLSKGKGISYDISGVIGISGDVKGSVTMSFPEDAAINIVSAFLGEKIDTVDDDTLDAIGELANIVAGYAKKYLDFDISISLPTVIAGKGLIIREPPDVFAFIVPFSCEFGNFDIGVGLKKEG